MDFEKLANDVFPLVIAHREYLHKNPELARKEYETSRYICETLDKLGVEYQTFEGINGVVATIGNHFNKTIAFRADMDALRIQEENNAPYASQKPGVMHACGHDVHTAVLLGLAKLISENRTKLHANIRLIFQHAEEAVPGGAVELIERGCLTGVDMIYGIHVKSELPVGTIAISKGAIMGSTDTIKVDIHGRGGHGACPHTTQDAVVIGANFIMLVQNIVSRMSDPMQPSVVTFGEFTAEAGANIICGDARIRGTSRAYDKTLRYTIHSKVEQCIKAACLPFEAAYEYSIKLGNPPVVNDSKATEIARECVLQMPGVQLTDCEPVLQAEDFAQYQDKVPGCFIFVGAYSHKIDGYSRNHHCGTFDVDMDCARYSLGLFVRLAFRRWR